MELQKSIETAIREYLIEQKILNENNQLADKVYFKTGKLSEDDKKIILSITNGNNYTKLISDFYYYLKQGLFNQNELIKTLKQLYDDVLNYNKNVYPIIGYDVFNPSNVSEIINGLQKRRKVIEEIRKLPYCNKKP